MVSANFNISKNLMLLPSGMPGFCFVLIKKKTGVLAHFSPDNNIFWIGYLWCRSK